MVVKRLRKEERRAQLLEVARGIVRQQGTEALTLGFLAERAKRHQTPFLTIILAIVKGC